MSLSNDREVHRLQYVADTRDLLKNGAWEMAVDRAETIRVMYPEIADGFLIGAAALEGAKNFAAAEALLRSAERLMDINKSIVIELAWLVQRQRRWADAIICWADVRRHFPDEPIGYVGAGVAFRESANFDSSDLILLEAIKLFPENASAMTEYAWTALIQRDFAEARRRWSEVRAKFPDDPRGYHGGGIAERDCGDLDAARDILDAGQIRFPMDLSIGICRATVASQRKDWGDALNRWQDLLLHFPDRADVAASLEQARSMALVATALPHHRPFVPWSTFVWDQKPLALAGEDDLRGIIRTEVDPPASWFRPAPSFVADLSRIKRGDGPREAALVRHAKYVTEMPRSVLFGTHHFHGILQEDGKIILQYTDKRQIQQKMKYYTDRHQSTSTISPVIQEIDGEFYCTTSHLSEDDTIYIKEPVFFGSPDEPGNFGMWLVNGLPSAHEFVKRNNEEKYLCWIQAEWQRSLLHLMGIDENQIVVQQPHRIYLCETVTLIQRTLGDLTITPSDRDVFSELKNRYPSHNTTIGEKIYVSRKSFTKKAGYRALLNEDELICALRQRGFLITEPETMTFPDQIRLFSRASAVIGLGGAAMFNTIFCRPGTKVLSIEISRAFSHNHANLFASLGLEYAFIFGSPDESDPAPVHKRWDLDVSAATILIDSFM